MSQTDFVSSIKTIPYPQQRVYDKLSDLNNLQALKDKLSEPNVEERLQQMAAEGGESKLVNAFGNLRERLEQLEFDRDTVTVGGSPLGNVSLRITEREEPKTIKLTGEGTPVATTMWVQLLPSGNDACKMRITLRADLNMFIRGMVSKPLQEGVEKMATMLASIPY